MKMAAVRAACALAKEYVPEQVLLMVRKLILTDYIIPSI
jgi:hypothetical protein